MDVGYRIEYGKTAEKFQIVDRKKKPFPVAVVAGLMILATLMIPKSREVVRDLILPGDGAVTAAAIETLVDGLRAGESLGDAVTVFCQEIIAGDGS